MRTIALAIFLSPLLTLGQSFHNDMAFCDNTSRLITGIQAAWHLEEASGTRYDQSRYGNILTPVLTPSGATGIIGNAVLFSKLTNNYLYCPATASIQPGTGDWTVAAWSKSTAWGTFNNPVIGQWTNAASALRSWAVVIDSAAGHNPYFSISTDGANLINVHATNQVITDSVWSLIIAAYDSVNKTINVSCNGGPVSFVSTGGYTPSYAKSSTTPLVIGRNVDTGGDNFTGSIDECYLWKRLLSASERRILWNNGAGQQFRRFSGIKPGTLDPLASYVHVTNTASAAIYKTNLIYEVFGSTSLPSEIGVFNTATNGVTGLTNFASSQYISMTNWTAKPWAWNANAPNGKWMLLFQGHSSGYNDASYNTVLQDYLNNHISVIGLVMPGGTDQVSGSTVSHDSGTNNLASFCGPAVVAVNALANAGASNIYIHGLSGGGWECTMLAALDDRLLKSFPQAGTLPLFCPSGRDWEQYISTRGLAESYIDLYVLGCTSGRYQEQILHINDNCCFNAYDYNLGCDYALAASNYARAIGGSYNLAWANITVHQWYTSVVDTYILPNL